MIKYLGSKRRLLPAILEGVAALSDVRHAVDLFSGTSRVGHALKARGIRVLANDHNAYAHILASCYVASDLQDVGERATALIDELNELPGQDGWFVENYATASRYLQPHNAARLQAMRDWLFERESELGADLHAVLLTAILEAADRVDSTTGVQMAYLKEWATRSNQPIRLRLPQILPRATAGKGEAHRLDALQAVEQLEGDLVYLDPPYNQHKYLGNYHVWETVVLWDAPAIYGTACKRIDCRERRSEFNSKRTFAASMSHIIARARARFLMVSFSDEGFVSRDWIEQELRRRGHVAVASGSYPRYVGASIGIHNPSGERVGEVGHRNNREHLFVVGEDASAVEDAAAAAQRAWYVNNTGSRASSRRAAGTMAQTIAATAPRLEEESSRPVEQHAPEVPELASPSPAASIATPPGSEASIDNAIDAFDQATAAK